MAPQNNNNNNNNNNNENKKGLLIKTIQVEVYIDNSYQ